MQKENNKIKLWTIQSALAWSILQDKGVLIGDGRRVDKNFLPAYQWMKDQMKKRIRNYKGYFPLWCWYNPKPDLRKKAHLTPGQKGIRLEFIKDRNDVLLSDFDSWHFVLNNQYLSLYEKEEVNKYAKSNIINSWDRIFDIDLLNNSELTGPVENIQGVVEEILLEEIISAQEFTAR